MTKVFIGGSRRITRLDAEVRQRIDRIVEQGLSVLVGDANGADRAVQAYLKSKGYDLVEVFCSGGSCRNNLGGWPVRAIPAKGKKRDFGFYAVKDRAMSDEASVGFMLWDKKSTGTLLNVLRLVRCGKKVVLYVSPDREFFEVRGEPGWNEIASRFPAELRAEVDRKASAESPRPSATVQGDLFEVRW